VEFLAGSEAAIIGTEELDRTVIEQLPELKVVAKYGVGLDSLDLDYMQQRGVRLGWTAGVNRRSVSELALSFLLGLSRNVFTSGYALKAGTWNKQGGCELSGKTVGIVGCGFIGEDLLKLLQPFQCRLLINDIVDKTEIASVYGARVASFDEILEQSDFVSLHTPLTDRTRGFISHREFERMRKNAYLINTARGGLVNQEALKAALIAGEIQGAALDVFADEPPSDLEFLRLPNLMVTPHIGGNAAEAVEAMGRAAIRGLLDAIVEAGIELPRVV
jgi:D-3-phosphoglycerate dehydrogenase